MKRKLNSESRRLYIAGVIDKIFRIILYIFMIVYCITLLIPIFWMILNSFKDQFEYYLNGSFSFPSVMRFENYSYFLNNVKEVRFTPEGRITYGLWDMFFYSIIWASAPSLVSVILVFLCAYPIARYKFPGGKFIYNLGIFLMVVPITTGGASSILILKRLGIYDNMLGQILTYNPTAFSGLHFLILYAACKSIPKEYEEAVFIDGGGYLKVLTSIMIPMLIATCGVLWVMNFIALWNDYNTFMVRLPSYANIALGMYNFQYNAKMADGVSMPQVLAGFVLVCIPSVILYLVNQKAISAKAYVGGIKG